MGIFSRLRESLSKSRQEVGGKLSELMSRTRKIDNAFFDELEEILIGADVGLAATLEVVARLREKKLHTQEEVMAALQEELLSLVGREPPGLNLGPGPGPSVIMVVGVNGSGKTTSIGKLAYRLRQEGKTVVVAAADTFRAAASDQLRIWAERAGVYLVAQEHGTDPAAVAYDAVQAARARGFDVVIVDTAGRLQTKVNLMEELKKVQRVIGRELDGAPHEVLLVLDATVGQNGLSQARIFQEATGVTGVVLTKLDGTAKGGIVIGIARELSLPVKLVGTGEKLEDLDDFRPQEFIDALLAPV